MQLQAHRCLNYGLYAEMLISNLTHSSGYLGIVDLSLVARVGVQGFCEEGDASRQVQRTRHQVEQDLLQDAVGGFRPVHAPSCKAPRLRDHECGPQFKWLKNDHMRTPTTLRGYMI